MEDVHEMLFFWRSVFTYLTLLGVQLILLGLSLAGFINAKKQREREILKQMNCPGTTRNSFFRS